MGASPVGVPSGAPGESANALAEVREAIKILEKALPKLPAGSDPWKAVNSALSGLGKHVAPSAEVPGVQQTALRNLAGDAGQNAMLQQVMASMAGKGGGGSAGAVPNAPPAGMPGAMPGA